VGARVHVRIRDVAFGGEGVGNVIASETPAPKTAEEVLVCSPSRPTGQIKLIA
jgi:hypothetical protein